MDSRGAGEFDASGLCHGKENRQFCQIDTSLRPGSVVAGPRYVAGRSANFADQGFPASGLL